MDLMPCDVTATLAVFPLHEITKEGKCGCGVVGCADIGKHPKVYWKAVAPGEASLGEMGQGVRTGAMFGFFVLDTDSKPEKGIDGEATLADLGLLEDLPETYTVRTGSGGTHRYFAYPSGQRVFNSQGKMGPGIDVRGDGGYVVGQDSAHVSGKKYEHIAGDLEDLAEAPPSLLDALSAIAPVHDGAVGEDWAPVELYETGSDEFTPEGAERMRQGMNSAKNAPAAIDGSNGQTALLVAAGFLTRGLELPVDESCALLLEHYNPRCSPPWDDGDPSFMRKVVESTKGTLRLGSKFEKLIDLPRARLAPKLEPGQTRTRKRKNPKHEYSVQGSDAPRGIESSEKNEHMTLNEIRYYLQELADWAGVLQYDEFSKRVWAVDPPIRMRGAEMGTPTDDDVISVMTYFSVTKGKEAQFGDAKRAIEYVAQENPFHPVKEYLESLPPAPLSVLDNLAHRLFGNELPISQVLVRKFLVSAVRRVLWPGCQVDTLLVLKGPQGHWKSTFAKVLFNRSPEGFSWFSSSPRTELDTPRAIETFFGSWCLEFQEFEAVAKQMGPSRLKAFLSTYEDKYRTPWKAYSETYARQFVGIGTSNSEDLLTDATGERRFWIVEVMQKTDLAWLDANADALWSAAYQIALQPHSREDCDKPNWHWLTPEEDADLAGAQEQFKEESPAAYTIRDLVAGHEFVQIPELMGRLVLGEEGSAARALRVSKAEVRDVLLGLGAKKGVFKKPSLHGGRTFRAYQMPPDIVALPKRLPVNAPGQTKPPGLNGKNPFVS